MGVGESIKKVKRDKNLFQIMFNEVLKSCKKIISADIKTNAKQVAVITFHRSAFSKLEMQCKTDLLVFLI